MNIDPATGLDLDDPAVQARLQGGSQPQLPAPSLFAMDIPRGAPAGLPSLGQDVTQAPPGATGGPPPIPPPAPPPPVASAPPVLTAPVIPARTGPPPLEPPSLTGTPGGTKSVSDQERSTSTQRTVIGKEERAAEGAYQKTLGQQEGVIRQAADVEGQRADINQAAAAEKDKLLQQHQARFKGIIDNANSEYARAEGEQKKAEEAYKSAKPEGLFADDKYGLRRFFAGVAIALGGYNSGVNGGPNRGYEMISDAINRKDRLERERIGRLKEGAESAKGQLNVVLGKKHEALGDLAAWKAAAWDTAAQQLETRLTALGRPAAEVKANAQVLQARAEAEKERATYLQATRQHITNQVTTKTQQIVGGAGAKAADKPLNEWKPEERKAEGFAMRAYKASEQMDATKYSPADLQVMRNASLLQAKGGLTEAGVNRLMGTAYQRLSPEGKRRFNATKEFVVSALRPESGAVIGPSEIVDAEQRYATMPGDTRETLEQKRQFRMNKVGEIGLQSGRAGFWMKTTGAYGGGEPAAGVQPGAAPAAAPRSGGLPPGAVAGTLKGQRGYVLNGQFVPLAVAQQ